MLSKFPQTENRKNWDNLFKIFVLKIFELEKRKIKRGL